MEDNQTPKIRQLPVSSMIDIPTPEDGAVVDITVQWGGFYYQEVGEKYFIVRLLDMDKGTVHLQLFRTAFTSIPSLVEVQNLQPAALHIPLLREFLFSAHLQYIGFTPLTIENLEGYRTYFSQLNWTEETIADYMEMLMDYSTQNPLTMRLLYRGGEIYSQAIE